MNAVSPESANPFKEFGRFLFELAKTLIIVIALAYLIRIFLLQPFIVEGLSMYPRFHDRDYLLVDKISYRIHEPDRGDIVVFHYPKDPEVNYVKRIIGLPGETIRIEDGRVYVINGTYPDGIVLNEDYLPSNNGTFANGLNDSTFKYTVPAGSYFVMGDNRSGSSDSREWGELPRDQVIGKVLVTAYPFHRAATVEHAKYELNDRESL